MAQTNNKRTIMCPAYTCKVGAQVLGVRQNDNTTVLLPQTFPVDVEFVEKVKQHSVKPERRFRFAGKCIEGGCEQWDGNNCRVVQRVMHFIEKDIANNVLPRCAIRDNCRWFIQEKEIACKACRYVLTEVSEEMMTEQLELTAGNPQKTI